MQCVLNLGDIIDGKCLDVERYGGTSIIDEEKKMESTVSAGTSTTGSVGHQAADDVLKALSGFTNGRIIHTYGEFALYICACATIMQ